MAEQFHIITGSNHIPKPNTKYLGILEDDHKISATIILNNKITDQDLSPYYTKIMSYATIHNLIIEKTNHSHNLKIIGKSKNFTNAFQIQLNMYKYKHNQQTYHATSSPIQIPIEWKQIVDDILGLNNSPIAHSNAKKLSKINVSTNPTPYYYPPQLATLYNFPTNTGIGQKIGIIELGGGYTQTDITTYLKSLNITTQPNISSVSIDSATNNPADTSGANIEVILDVEVILAIVPSASVIVYFCPNTDQGFYDGILSAINNSCNIISISWGGAEADWSQSTMTTYNNLFQSASGKKITILAAAGDNGSSDGVSGLSPNVDFPASSPYVLACGGTHLTSNSTTILSETVWNDSATTSATGGGLSNTFPKPTYQSSVSYALNNKRGVPDIAGNADPNSGYIIYSKAAGGNVIVGGTSAVAPLWSGLLARINSQLGFAVGFIHPQIYSNPTVCRDITQGNNGAYAAGIGWDPCTGLGSPIGISILNLLSTNKPIISPTANFTTNNTNGSSPLTINFSDTSTNGPTTWSWTFGPNNATSTAQNPTYTYITVGTYTISLTVSNAAGSNTLTKTNYITITTPLISVFTANPTTSTSNHLTVKFTDKSTGSPTYWLWNFGNGTTSMVQNPTCVYTKAGSYTVSLTVKNKTSQNESIKTNYIIVK